MRKKLIITAVIVTWLVALAWFLRFEAFPDYFTHSISSYKSLFSKGVLVKDSWMKIMFRGKAVGYTHTAIETDDDSVLQRYTMQNDIMLNMNIMGMSEKIRTTANASLDALYRLQTFKLDIDSRTTSTRISGRRRKGNTFMITIKPSAGRGRKTLVQIPDDTLVYSPVTEMAVLNLKPGQQISLKMLEPITMKPSSVLIRALPDEEIVFGGSTTNCRVLATDYMGMTTRSWIDHDGRVLRQELPLKDFIAESCDAGDAIAAGASAGADSGDLLQALSVKCAGGIPNPTGCTNLVVRFHGAPTNAFLLESHRQQAGVPGPGGSYRVRAVSDVPFIRGETAPAGNSDPTNLAKFLESTAYIQSDDPVIIQRARDIVGTNTGADAAMALYRFVNQGIVKTPSPGMPSALDVLNTMQGDCNEHTYLYAALARALGLPAKVKVGIVYQRGAFYYHAWPAVFAAGRWVEMDPTFGQEAVDATHIAIVEGELADQVMLVKLIGHLGADIESADCVPGAEGDEE